MNQTQLNFYSAQKSNLDANSRQGTGNAQPITNPNISIQIPGMASNTPRNVQGIQNQQVAPSYQNYLFSENPKPYFRSTQVDDSQKNRNFVAANHHISPIGRASPASIMPPRPPYPKNIFNQVSTSVGKTDGTQKIQVMDH